MNILYVGNDRTAAQLAAKALHGIAPSITLIWARSLASARRWVQDNRDAAVFILEAEVDGQGSASFVDFLRGAGVAAPVVVVAREGLDAPLGDLRADYVVSQRSVPADLRPAVVEALRRTPAAAPGSPIVSPSSGAGERQRSDPEPHARNGSVLDAVTAGVSSSRDEELGTAGRGMLERKLAAAESARAQAEQRYAAAEARLAEGRTQHQAELSRTGKICKALEHRALELEAALHDVEQMRASDAAASADRLVRQHAEFAASLAQAARARDTLAQQLAMASAALEEGRQTRIKEESAAAARLAQREAELGATLAEAIEARTALEQKLTDANASLDQAEQRASAEQAAIEQAAAERAAQLETRLGREMTGRKALEEDLAAVKAALEESRRARASDAAAAERLAAREAALGDALQESLAARAALEQVQAELQAAHHEAAQRSAADLAAAAARQADLEQRLAHEVEARGALEKALENAEAARLEARERHESELRAAAAHLADVQAQSDAAAERSAEERAALERRLDDAAAALEESRRARVMESAAAAERHAQREAELGDALEGSLATRATLERALAEAEAAHRQADARTTADLAAAESRQTELEERLAQEGAMRTALERDVSESRSASARTRRRLLDVASAIRRRTREHDAAMAEQLDRERADHDRTLGAREQEIRHLKLECETLQQSLHVAEQELQRLSESREAEREEYEHARAAREIEFERLSADYAQVRQSLDRLRANFDALERISREHAEQRARLEEIVADRDAQLSAQASRHTAAEQTASAALAQIQGRLQLTIQASAGETAQLRQELDALRGELDAARAQANALRGDAERVPVLLKHLEESRSANRRQFERAPCGMCRCNSDGTVAHANRALARLLGYRTAEELRNVDLARTVFESPGDLHWLIERAAATGTTEWVEATWRKKDRRRIAVRLQLHSGGGDSVDVLVEDVTALRAVEEKLSRARRMEAVGRLASEVAATCDNLLRDVSANGQLWLDAIGGDAALRRHGELLLADVARAASFLRQLSVYGSGQLNALDPVGVHRVLRDLEPVLKRVAGGDIEIVLPRKSGSADFDVDVETERVERVLVNVASYARQRMPYGGRLQIDLATTVVDSRFAAKHPHVRRGNHVLITVTEVARPRPSEPIALETEGSAAGAGSSPEKPGVDLGILLGLIADCGGHLWMTAEPPGKMTLKISLPKRTPDDMIEPDAAVAKVERGRSLARWFRH